MTQKTHAQSDQKPPEAGGSHASVSFGPFRLYPASRSIEKDGVPIALGNRALDILTALVERPGEVVSHRELMARVWRGLVVDPGNLRVHINSLRRALDDRDGKERYIANVTGQGYAFVASVQQDSAGPPPKLVAEPAAAAARQQTLPAMLARMVGRDAAVQTITTDVVGERFLTIIGPGGIGKTTVAVSVAHSLLEEFAGAVCFIDLSAIVDPRLVAATLASALGVAVQTDDVLPALMLFLRAQRILLVLDNCEHVIDAVAALAERIIQETTGVHILATSREAMRVEGEHAFWLPPLSSPPEGTAISAEQALEFPAVRLFVERAAASGVRLELTDADAASVAAICAGLDGIPLAIEFAAARVGAYGIAGTANILKSHVSLQLHGRRTALPRHQTLQSLLDWSFELLLDAEKRVLRRLSIFVGSFTLEAAQAVAADERNESMVFAAIESLVAKSLVSSALTKDAILFRLLETTRVYALEKLAQSGEQPAIADRHARHCSSVLARIAAGSPGTAAEHLGNIRAALEWVFRDNPGDQLLAVELAASAVKPFIDLSLLTECHRWSTAALALLDDETRGSRQELVLQEAVAISSTWMLANHLGVGAAFARALEIAHNLGDTTSQLRLLAGQHLFLTRTANVRESLRNAEQFELMSRRADASSEVIADFLIGISHHFMGNQGPALVHLGRGFDRADGVNLQPFGLNSRLRANLAYIRALWIGGFPDRALAHARGSIEAAEASGRALNICFIRMYTAPMFLWRGDLDAAREGIERAITHPNWPALASIHDAKQALQGTLWLREGDSARAIPTLQSAVVTMRANQQMLLLATAVCSLAEGLVATRRYDEAEALIDRAVSEAGPDTEGSHFPEILRLHAHILLSKPAPDETRAEDILRRSLLEARRQCALSWELRAAMTLARLRMQQGRALEAKQELSSIYNRFEEGFATADLRAASDLLRELEASETQASSISR